MMFDPAFQSVAKYILAFLAGFAIRHYAPKVAAFIAVHLMRIKWHGQAQ